ncbi:Uncharacterised protein [Serratia liquefaciens]|nr:Uncharacterised protein [Serratia liquefaciens]
MPTYPLNYFSLGSPHAQKWGTTILLNYLDKKVSFLFGKYIYLPP